MNALVSMTDELEKIAVSPRFIGKGVASGLFQRMSKRVQLGIPLKGKASKMWGRYGKEGLPGAGTQITREVSNVLGRKGGREKIMRGLRDTQQGLPKISSVKIAMTDELEKIAKKGGFGRVLKRVGKGLKSPIGKGALIGAGVGSAVGLAGSAIRRHPAYEKRVQTGLAKAKLEATRHPSLSSKEEVTRLETELKNIKAHRQHSTASKVRGGLVGGLAGVGYGGMLGVRKSRYDRKARLRSQRIRETWRRLRGK